ncbi:MAG: hypothetical protein GY803_09290 [Chloroflexi bacterium]|nr:hypothetical protein [Chloroflexota bacterium]
MEAAARWPFDDAYYDDMFRDADLLYDEALLLFDSGEEKGSREDAYQLVMPIFAVGLTFAGWPHIAEVIADRRKGNAAPPIPQPAS